MAIGQLLMTGATRKKKALPERATAYKWMGSPERASAVAAGEATALADATGRARERTARERGIPTDYEPGQIAATARPDSFFVNDPTRRAGVEAKERVAGRDLMTNAPSRKTAMGDPFGLSRGTGLGPVSTGAPPQLRKGGTYQVSLTGGATTFPADTKIFPGGAAATEMTSGGQVPAGLPAGREGGFVRLRGSYLSPEQAVMQAQREGKARQQHIAGPYDPAAQTALRAQRGPWEERRGIESLATEGAGRALMRAQDRAGAEVAPGMAQAGLEQAQAGVGRTQAQTEALSAQANALNAMAQQAMSGDVQTRQAVQEAMDSATASGAPPEVIATLRDIQMGQFGMERVDPGVLEQVYAMLRPYATLLGGVLAGPAGAVAGGALPASPGPSYQPTPATGAQVITGPTAAPAASMAGAGPAAGAQAGLPAAAEQEERELYERLKAKYGV